MEDRKKMAGWLRLAGRVVGFAMVGFGGTMLIGEAASEYLRKGFVLPELAGILLAVIGVVALAGLILTFRRERVGGIMLVACSAALGVHITNYAGRNHALPGRW